MKPIKGIGFDYWGVLGGMFGADKEMLSLAHDLQQKGYKVGVLSSMDIPGKRLAEKHGLADLDVVLTSEDLGCSKPSREAFAGLAQALGIELDELLFIDDREACLAGIEAFGVRSILYTKYDRLIEALQRLRVID